MKSLIEPVTIQGVPRSGTSWLGQIFRSSPQVMLRFQPLFSYAFKDRLHSSSSREDILKFFEDIRNTKDAFVLQNDPEIHIDYPVLKEHGDATHLVMKEVRYNHIVRNLITQMPEIKVIGLVRHPCAVMHSWINAPREFKPDWNVLEQWRSGALKNQGRPEEFFGFDKWKETAALFVELERKSPDQMIVARYADLNSNTLSVVHELFTFCGLDLGPSTKKFIQESKSKEGLNENSVYRLERPDDAWKGNLPKEIIDTIYRELSGSSLERFLV